MYLITVFYTGTYTNSLSAKVYILKGYRSRESFSTCFFHHFAKFIKHKTDKYEI